MAPTVTFIRHAQGYHNLNTAGHQIRDPLLTPYGQQQCVLLSRSFPQAETPDLIVVSPLKRTIYTALHSFPNLIEERRMKLLALPELQETSNLPCDTGSPRSQLEREFQGKPVDLSLVVDDWESKQGKWAPEWDAIEQRAKGVRLWLKNREQKHIAVVTHGAFLHHLTGDWADHDKFAGTGWANTEYRTYTFDSTSPSNPLLIETEESRTRRRGLERPLGESEQRNLQLVASSRRQIDSRSNRAWVGGLA